MKGLKVGDLVQWYNSDLIGILVKIKRKENKHFGYVKWIFPPEKIWNHNIIEKFLWCLIKISED